MLKYSINESKYLDKLSLNMPSPLKQKYSLEDYFKNVKQA